MFSDLFKSDIKFIGRHPILLMAIVVSFLLILFLRLVFPLISDFVILKTDFRIDNYYTLTAITMVSVIPMLFGIAYAFILTGEKDLHFLQGTSVTPAGKKNFLYVRMIKTAFLSFIMILLSIILTDPVPTEGWVRTIFVSLLLSTQASFVFLLIGSLAGNRAGRMALSKLSGVFLVVVPLGLLLHHPLNYFAFFSPLYWISWAWITPLPSESILYGAISIIITFGCILIFFRHFLKKYSN